MTPPPVLLYVPGLTRSESNNAARVAQLIASTLSRRHPGTYSVKADSVDGAPAALSVLGPQDDVILRVVEVDYRPRLADSPGLRDGAGWSLLRAARFALLGLLRLVGARRASKTGRHRWFLFLGFLLVLALLGVFAACIIAALAAFGVDQLRPIAKLAPIATLIETAPVETGAGLGVVTAGLVWLRGKVLAEGQRTAEVVRYLERDREGASVALALDVAIDQVLDASPAPPAIHILAYSFGSIVTLDALFCRLPARSAGTDRIADAVTSLVTVGAPVDFVRQFYPSYFAERAARRAQLAWTNLFLPDDLLGSNFLDDDDHSGFDAPPPKKDVFAIGGVGPARSLAVGTSRLTLRSLLSLEGFRVHGEYWDDAHRANLLEPVIEGWLGGAHVFAVRARARPSGSP